MSLKNHWKKLFVIFNLMFNIISKHYMHLEEVLPFSLITKLMVLELISKTITKYICNLILVYKINLRSFSIKIQQKFLTSKKMHKFHMFTSLYPKSFFVGSPTSYYVIQLSLSNPQQNSQSCSSF